MTFVAQECIIVRVNKKTARDEPELLLLGAGARLEPRPWCIPLRGILAELAQPNYESVLRKRHIDFVSSGQVEKEKRGIPPLDPWSW